MSIVNVLSQAACSIDYHFWSCEGKYKYRTLLMNLFTCSIIFELFLFAKQAIIQSLFHFKLNKTTNWHWLNES